MPLYYISASDDQGLDNSTSQHVCYCNYAKKTRIGKDANGMLQNIKYCINTVEPRSIIFQGDGENKRWMREND
jgi:hypothetical protein